jgi:hypothetical protein
MEKTARYAASTKSKKSIFPYSPKVFERGLGKTFSKKFSPAKNHKWTINFPTE